MQYATAQFHAHGPSAPTHTLGEPSGRPITLPCNAYLIRHAGEWIMWDTGIDDAIADESGGRIIAHGLGEVVVRSVREQLGEIGLMSADVTRVVLSHAHFNHVGNAALFAHAT